MFKLFNKRLLLSFEPGRGFRFAPYGQFYALLSCIYATASTVNDRQFVDTLFTVTAFTNGLLKGLSDEYLLLINLHLILEEYSLMINSKQIHYDVKNTILMLQNKLRIMIEKYGLKTTVEQAKKTMAQWMKFHLKIWKSMKEHSTNSWFNILANPQIKVICD